MNLTQLAPYRKSALALLGAVATIIVTSGVHATWATAIVTLATALGVYLAPNATSAGSEANPSSPEHGGRA